ncbi:At2g23090 like protein [Podospora didyma]|uniref:At2g23090 like protein n=1 Tax=Podospora didyma TaxID=330526 RepID=A0AAE0U7T5_9PEZI|nr:At2g23090 like protein [Podospora didyma]
MGGGNGAKAASKRARADKNAKPAAKSQLKTNVAAMNVQCAVCKTPFLTTVRAAQLLQHAENKHSTTMEACFPEYQVPA